MAGKRQHFVPRFLQQGFISRVSGKQRFTWVYRKGVPAFETNISNVGAETHFYSNGFDTEADDLITAIEGSFGQLVQNLRDAQAGPVDDPQIPELIAHLEVRTRHLRQSFLRAGDFLFSRVLDFMADETAVVSYLERRFLRDPSMLIESFAEEFAKRGLPTSLAEPAVRACAPLLPMLLEQVKPNITLMARQLRILAPNMLRDAAKTGHIRALKKAPVPEPKLGRYRELIYSVAHVPEGSFVLGDSIVVHQTESPKPYRPFLDKDDILTAVYLPLSSTTLLVGSAGKTPEIPPTLSSAIARCSLEFFIANTDSKEHGAMVTYIGADSALLSDSELEAIFSEVMME